MKIINIICYEDMKKDYEELSEDEKEKVSEILADQLQDEMEEKV